MGVRQEALPPGPQLKGFALKNPVDCLLRRQWGMGLFMVLLLETSSNKRKDTDCKPGDPPSTGGLIYRA